MSQSNQATQELRRAQALLPWFVNGSLSAVDEQWLKEWLEYHPEETEIHTELVWLKQTANQVKSSVELPDADHGLDLLLSKIHQEKSIAAEVKRLANRSAQSPRSLWSKFIDLMSSPIMSMGLVALLLVQTGVIKTLLNSKNSPNSIEQSQDLTPLSGSNQPVNGTVLQLTFVPSSTEAQMSKILNNAHAEIVSGPGALGIYVVQVPSSDADRAVKAFEQEKQVIESVRQP